MRKLIILSAVFMLMSASSAIAQQNTKDVILIQDYKGTVEENRPVELNDLENDTLKGGVTKYAEFHILNDIQLDVNEVSGPGKASSSLSDGTMYLENLNFYGKGEYGKLKYMFNVGGRATNDNRIDQRAMSLTSLKGQATYENHTLSAGDVFESFSQYSLNTNLKGVSYKYYDETDDLPDVTAVWGYTYPRWDSIFKADNVRVMGREAYGLNIRKDLTYLLDAGFSYMRSNDTERLLSSETMYNNNVYSLDYEYRPIPGLTIRGENAFSQGQKQLTAGGRFDSYFGQAHRLEALAVGGPSRVNLNYEYVSANFETLLGSAIKDRQKANGSWKYKINKNTEMNTSMLWYQTGLRSGLQSIQTFRPTIGITKRRFLNRRYAQAGIDYKMNISTGNHRHTNDHFIDLNYRDRFGFLNFDNRFGFNTYHTNHGQRQTYDYNYYTTIDSRHKLGMFVLKPSINAGTNFIDDEIRNSLDKIVEYSVGMGLDIPKYKLTSNVKFGQNILDTGIGDNSNKLFTSLSIYYKPTFLGMLNRSTFFVRLALNDYNFSTKSRNFAEKSFSIGMNMPVDFFVGKKKSQGETL